MPRKSQGNDEGLSVDDLALPKSMVQRLAKGVLPANSQIQKDAVAALSRSATVFVNYLTAEAHERAADGGKLTIQPQFVFEALKDLEFDAFIPRCKDELQKYNSIQCDKRNSYRAKVRQGQKDKDAKPGADADTSMASNAHANESEQEAAGPHATNGHIAKKIRRSSGPGAAVSTDEGVDMDDDYEAEEDARAEDGNDEDEDSEAGAEGSEEAEAEVEAAKNEEVDDDLDEDSHRPGFEDQDEDSAEED